MNPKPIIHVHCMNDDFKEWSNLPDPPHFEEYLQVTPGRIFESYGGFDPLESSMNFRDSIDGYAYFAFAEGSDKPEDVTYFKECS